MQKPESGKLKVEKYRHDLEVIRNTAKQIIKDFELSGSKITFSGNEHTAYEELKEQIVPILAELSKNETGKFQSLLYRVDVDEKKVLEILSNPSEKFRAEQLANLVIEREFVKAIFRKLYS